VGRGLDKFKKKSEDTVAGLPRQNYYLGISTASTWEVEKQRVRECWAERKKGGRKWKARREANGLVIVL